MWNETTAMGLLVVNNDRGYYDQYGENIDLEQRGQTTTQKASVTRARRTKNAGRQPPRQASTVQSEGVRKTRNSRGRQTHKLCADEKF